MDKTVFISLPIDELQTVIIDCVNACLRNNNRHTPAENPDRWHSLDELCNYLPDKPTKPTIYGWVHNRIIPFHKRGKKLYFLQSEIDSWLKAGRKKTIAETAKDADSYLAKKKGGRL